MQGSGVDVRSTTETSSVCLEFAPGQSSAFPFIFALEGVRVLLLLLSGILLAGGAATGGVEEVYALEVIRAPAEPRQALHGNLLSPLGSLLASTPSRLNSTRTHAPARCVRTGSSDRRGRRCARWQSQPPQAQVWAARAQRQGGPWRPSCWWLRFARRRVREGGCQRGHRFA